MVLLLREAFLDISRIPVCRVFKCLSDSGVLPPFGRLKGRLRRMKLCLHAFDGEHQVLRADIKVSKFLEVIELIPTRRLAIVIERDEMIRRTAHDGVGTIAGEVGVVVLVGVESQW